MLSLVMSKAGITRHGLDESQLPEGAKFDRLFTRIGEVGARTTGNKAYTDPVDLLEH